MKNFKAFLRPLGLNHRPEFWSSSHTEWMMQIVFRMTITLAWPQLCCEEKRAGPVAITFLSLEKKQWETTSLRAGNFKLHLAKTILVSEKEPGLFIDITFPTSSTAE